MFEWKGQCYNIDLALQFVENIPFGFTSWTEPERLVKLIVQDPLYGPDPWPDDPGNAQEPGMGVQIPKRVAMEDPNIDPSYPGIAILTGEGEIMLIDGWKRAYRAWRRNQERFYFYVLNDKSTKDIMMDHNPLKELEEMLKELKK
jgi:hypothetical protein